MDGALGRAWANQTQALAWRDTGAPDHEIEVTPYKLTGGGGPNSLGGVVVGLSDQHNFVGYELVKTDETVLNGPESKSVIYLRIAGIRDRGRHRPEHPELARRQRDAAEIAAPGSMVDMRLRKVGPVITAYLNDVVDATYTLTPAQAEAPRWHQRRLRELRGTQQLLRGPSVRTPDRPSHRADPRPHPHTDQHADPHHDNEPDQHAVDYWHADP